MIRFKNENQNSARNFNSVSINGVKFWFSYETCVAVSLRTSFKWDYVFVIQNYWSNTTGKHLNRIDRWGNDKRLSQEDFDTILCEAYRQVGLVPNENE